MVMRWLIQEWIAQLLGLMRRPDRTTGPDSWWLGIRGRILRFLVTRYADEPAPEGHEAAAPPAEMRERETYCIVEPEHHPARARSDLATKLRSVGRINRSKGPRWRWL